MRKKGFLLKKQQSIDKVFKILESISGVYIFLIVILFPLMVDKTGFFRIQECKYNYFLLMSITYLSSCLLLVVYLFINKVNIFQKKKLTVIQLLAIIYLMCNIISYFCSPYLRKYNLFVGLSRQEGLLTNVLYILSFIFVSYFGKFKKKYILYFSIASIFINLIAILQFVGFNPLNMYQDGIGTHNVSFMTTIGNVDFISAIFTILLSVSFCSYLFLNDNRIEKIVHLLSVFFGSFIFQIIDVSSGKLVFGILLVILLPFIFQTNKRLSNFLRLVASILLATVINIFINVEYHYSIGKLGFYFQFNYIVVMYIVIIILLYILSMYLDKLFYDVTNNRRLIKNYYQILGIAVIVGLIGLYLIPFKSGFLYEIHELLHFNFDDNFGTYRIFLWKRTIPLIKDYPLFGSGPDSFSLRFMSLYTDDIVKLGPLTNNDTAANIYFTMLINLGIVGTISYLIFLISQVKLGIKNMTNYSYILLISIVCYMIQSFFNLSVVIVSPIFWITMAIHHLSIYDYVEKEGK
jgi:putative inorganic carbon (HCO3(-)) transporter